MGKINRVQSTLLIAALEIVSVSALPIQAAIRQYPRQSVAEVNNKYLALSWGDIWKRLGRKKASGGSRGPKKPRICMIAPGKLRELDRDHSDLDGKIEVGSDRPLFLWQESMVGIEVRHLPSDELMWSQPLESEARSITYAGKPLQPGEVYYWRETLPLEEVPHRVSFRMMEAEKIAVITAELEQRSSKLKAQGASANKIALERVNYFIERGFWSDALREIYSKPNLFSQLIEKIESHDFCPEPEEEKNISLFR